MWSWLSCMYVLKRDIAFQMFEHLKRNENDLNELLAEYWAVRRDSGMSLSTSTLQREADACSIEVYMETLADKFGITIS